VWVWVGRVNSEVLWVYGCVRHADQMLPRHIYYMTPLRTLNPKKVIHGGG